MTLSSSLTTPLLAHCPPYWLHCCSSNILEMLLPQGPCFAWNVLPPMYSLTTFLTSFKYWIDTNFSMRSPVPLPTLLKMAACQLSPLPLAPELLLFFSLLEVSFYSVEYSVHCLQCLSLAWSAMRAVIFVCFVHWVFIPSTQNSAWHGVGMEQYTDVELIYE